MAESIKLSYIPVSEVSKAIKTNKIIVSSILNFNIPETFPQLPENSLLF